MQSEYYDQKDSSVSTNQPVLIQYKHGRGNSSYLNIVRVYSKGR